MADKNTPTKVPGLPPVPDDITPSTKAYLKALGEALEVRLGRRGDVRDRAITLRELIDSGLAIKLKSEPFNPNALTKTNIGLSPVGGPIVTIPPAPSNLVASGAFKNVVLTWSDPNFIYGNHAYTEVFRQNAQAADPDGIALAQTTSSAGDLTLNGVLMTEDATNGTSINSSVQFFQPTTVNIVSLTGNNSSLTFTVTGTNTADGAVNDIITGANGSSGAATATGDQIFKTITQVAVNGAITGNVTVGPAESVDAIGSAASIGTSGAMTVTDSSGTSGEAYFYWIRFVSTGAIAGPFNKTEGTIASTVRIQETDISEDAITTPKLAAGSITADQAQLATASVVTASIASAAITDAKINFLANDQAVINTAHIVDTAITNAKIGTAAVGTLSINGNAVTVPDFNTYTDKAVLKASGEQDIFNQTSFVISTGDASITAPILITVTGYHSARDDNSDEGDSGVILKLYVDEGSGSGLKVEQISGTETDSGTNYICVPFSMTYQTAATYRTKIRLSATPVRIQTTSGIGAYTADCNIIQVKSLRVAVKR